jgi:acetyl esterase/lipase
VARSFGVLAAAAALIVGAIATAPTASAASAASAASTAKHPTSAGRHSSSHAAAPYAGTRVIANIRYGTADGAPLLLDICLPAAPTASVAPRPAIVSIHGGSWAHGDKSLPEWRDVCQWLASEGYVTASVGYRLAPQHPFPAAISDIRAAVRWLRAPAQAARYSIDPTLIGAFGGSAGGDLAALLGTTGRGAPGTGDRVAAVAELSGPTNLTASGAELPDFQHYVLSYLHCADFAHCPDAVTASPLMQVRRGDPPFFVGHSISERIPLVQSQAFVAKLRSVGVDTTFVTVQGTRHSIAMLDAAMRTRISAFFHAKLIHPSKGSSTP